MIIEQLTDIYINKENWHKSKLTKEEANAYHERLLVQGNIITYIIENRLIGYVEFWRINPEQLGRIILGIPVFVDSEDILNGNIAYVNNMYIDEEYRDGDVFEILSSMFLSRNRDAEYFVACRNMKHNKPIQVYKREELIRLYTKGV